MMIGTNKFCWELETEVVDDLDITHAVLDKKSGNFDVAIYDYSETTQGNGYGLTGINGYTCFSVIYDYLAYVPVSSIRIDLAEVISDQISTRECNKLPSMSPNNPMLVATRSGNDTHLAIRATVQPASALSMAKIGIRRVGVSGAVINSVTPFQSPQKTLLNFDVAEGFEHYEIVAGIDADGNGLDTDEISTVFEQQIRVVTYHDYNGCIQVIKSVCPYLVFGIAQDLVDHFLTGGPASPEISGATRFFYLQDSSDPDHPLGQDWNGNCQSACARYKFADGSAVSDTVEDSHQIKESIRQSLAAHRAVVQNYFLTPGSLDYYQFPAWSWNGAFEANDWLDISDPQLGIFGAFGSFSVTGTVQVTVRKSDFEVTQIHYSGAFDDDYDFNVTRQYNLQGAVIQTGYPTLGVAGRIFKTRVEFTFDSSSFDYTFQ